jgi:hypothetical protein
MLTATERQEMIAKLRELPARIEAIANNLSDQQLDQVSGAEAWTIRQVVHHLADAHLNAFVRLKLILTEDQPTLKPYNQDLWASLPDVNQVSIQSSLLILKGLHQRWIYLLEHLAEADWSRPALHPEIGRITAEDLLAIYARHGDDHLEQISRLLAE